MERQNGRLWAESVAKQRPVVRARKLIKPHRMHGMSAVAKQRPVVQGTETEDREQHQWEVPEVAKQRPVVRARKRDTETYGLDQSDEARRETAPGSQGTETVRRRRRRRNRKRSRNNAR